jgi:hypothetical protein
MRTVKINKILMCLCLSFLLLPLSSCSTAVHQGRVEEQSEVEIQALSPEQTENSSEIKEEIPDPALYYHFLVAQIYQSEDDVENAMKGHILAQATLIGLFKR